MSLLNHPTLSADVQLRDFFHGLQISKFNPALFQRFGNLGVWNFSGVWTLGIWSFLRPLHVFSPIDPERLDALLEKRPLDRFHKVGIGAQRVGPIHVLA